MRERQQAVRELCPSLDLREDLARLGEEVTADDDPEGLSRWATAAPLLVADRLAWVAATLSVGNVAALGLWLWGGAGNWPVVVALVVSGGFVAAHYARVGAVLRAASRPEHELELLAGVLARLERERFDSPRLRELRSQLEVDGSAPSQRIARLARLVEMNDSRRNMIFAPIAALLLVGRPLAVIKG